MKLGSLVNRLSRGSLSRFGRKPEVEQRPEILSGIRFPYGAFRFKSHIGQDVAFEILASSDLTNWQTIVADTAPHDLVEYVDTDAHKFSCRFYRILVGSEYSENTFGYVTITLPPGFSSIANPLKSSAGTVGTLFADMPDGTKFHKFDPLNFVVTENGVSQGKWARPSDRFLPGEGGIIFNPTSDYRPLSFVGNVMQGSISTPIPSGFSMRSSLIPRPGRLMADLGFPAVEGDVIHLYDRDKQAYALYPYDPEKWAAESPVIGVAESFWVAKAVPGTWKQSLNLNMQTADV